MSGVWRTMVHALHDQAERLEDGPALWTKRGGKYEPTSWADYAQRVKSFALGLHASGFGPGSALAVLSFNREEWLLSELAAMALGGVAVGLYTTSSPEQIAYILKHCEAKVVVVENGGYLATIQKLRPSLPKLERVIVIDPPATLTPGVSTFEQITVAGDALDDAPYWDLVEALKPEGLATLIYTSGTTGEPKGVMLSHRNICWTAKQLFETAHLTSGDRMVSYLPLSHIAEQVGTIYGPLHLGMQVYFAESIEKVPENLRDVRPTVFFGVPRVWEKFKAKAEQGMAAQPLAKRALIAWARRTTLAWQQRHTERHWISPALNAQHALAQRLVIEPLKQKIGFDRTRIFATSAAPIGRDVIDFFASIDVVLRELYGQSEVTGPTSANVQDATRLGSVGRAMTGVEVRIAPDGEVLVRGENVCLGYFKDPAATAELIEDGWLHSGDVGELDGDGYLRITGRKKELIVTSGGKKTAPTHIEGLLKSIPPVGNAVVIGEAKSYLVALLPLDPERVPALAQERGWPAEPQALVKLPAFRAYLEQAIEKDVNAHLARFESIKKFEVLPSDFTIAGGELTPTLKVRRAVVARKHASLIDSLYGETAATASRAESSPGA